MAESSSSPPSDPSSSSGSTPGDDLREQYFNEKFWQFDDGCNQQGDANACFSLGEWYQLLKKDYAKAAEIYGENCEKRGHGNSCYNLSLLYWRGQGVDKDRGTAAKLVRRSCEKGKHAAACQQFAWLHLLRGLGLDKAEPARALAMLTQQCADEDWQSCYYAGSVHLRGDRYDLDRSPAAAIAPLTRACELGGHPTACQVLAVLYNKGDVGVDKDADLFAKYKKMTEDLVAPHTTTTINT